MKKLYENALTVLIAVFVLAVTCMTVIKNTGSTTFRLLLQEASSAEESINDRLFSRKYLLYPSQMLNAATGKTYYPEMQGYINDQGSIVIGSPSVGHIDYALSQITGLSDYCKMTNRDFAYFILPIKPEYDRELTDIGIDCHRNETADLFADGLSESGVPFLDLRSRFRSEEDYYSFFYNTDHHWTADAGLIASQEIASFLNRTFSTGLNETAIEDSNMTRTVLSSSWIGESGRKALGIFGEKDDFIIIRPAYETNFSYYSEPHKEHLEGDFDVLTYEPILEKDGTSDTGTTYYYYYLRDNKTPVEIINNSEQNGDILVIKDSFANSMVPFIALTAHKITLWDMRSDTELIKYLDSHPEITTVIVAYNTNFVTTSYMNIFFED